MIASSPLQWAASCPPPDRTGPPPPRPPERFASRSWTWSWVSKLKVHLSDAFFLDLLSGAISTDCVHRAVGETTNTLTAALVWRHNGISGNTEERFEKIHCFPKQAPETIQSAASQEFSLEHGSSSSGFLPLHSPSSSTSIPPSSVFL